MLLLIGIILVSPVVIGTAAIVSDAISEARMYRELDEF